MSKSDLGFIIFAVLGLGSCASAAVWSITHPVHQVDPYCASYVALPGEPCKPGMWLDVPYRAGVAMCYCAMTTEKP